MTYEYVQSVSALTGLLLFMSLFAGVLLYVFWPGNQRGFDEASRIPLENLDPEDKARGGKNGR
jgi:cytochrome c oxidase cbb3-type subunit 4